MSTGSPPVQRLPRTALLLLAQLTSTIDEERRDEGKVRIRCLLPWKQLTSLSTLRGGLEDMLEILRIVVNLTRHSLRSDPL
ncbi:hypothetical protein B0H13DRAFT_2305950 [Mycena leptocephala]|nr:hypothetical protein B0H13DRAFT_2305950 [Mycena leptocephala]